MLEDEPFSLEEQAKFDARMRAYEAGFEAQNTAAYGPPELRARKNRRYAERLVRRYSEPMVRALLQALATQDYVCGPQEDLAEFDLTQTPLWEIITPFELYGLHFTVLSNAGGVFEVSLWRSMDRVGGGGEFTLTPQPDGTFHNESQRCWIC